MLKAGALIQNSYIVMERSPLHLVALESISESINLLRDSE